MEQTRKLSVLIFRGLIISGFIFFVAYYLNLLDATQHSRIENERLKKENLHARLESLKQQLSPHFLFNTLNTLSSLTKEARVKAYVAELSNVYRYLLQYKENDMVRVADELAFLDSYSYILRERFEGGFLIQIKISDDVRNTLLPPLALQSLVENAIKHNVVSIARPLIIEIGSADGFIFVRNNYQAKRSFAEQSSHSGLNNINDRYKLLAHREIVIERSDIYFTVKLPILL
jgi:LytS/YehU family sensor histidine kinase